MKTILAILLILAMVATLVALIRGIVAFLQATEADLKGEVNMNAVRQNKAMQQRILFQGAAVLIAAVVLPVEITLSTDEAVPAPHPSFLLLLASSCLLLVSSSLTLRREEAARQLASRQANVARRLRWARWERLSAIWG